MPKTKIDYGHTTIYKISCNDSKVKHVYVGYTTNIIQRKYFHKNNCINHEATNYSDRLYAVIRKHGGWENWKMENIHVCNCEDYNAAKKVTQEYAVESFVLDFLVFPSRIAFSSIHRCFRSGLGSFPPRTGSELLRLELLDDGTTTTSMSSLLPSEPSVSAGSSGCSFTRLDDLESCSCLKTLIWYRFIGPTSLRCLLKTSCRKSSKYTEAGIKKDVVQMWHRPVSSLCFWYSMYQTRCLISIFD